jgi:hypothetical protein
MCKRSSAEKQLDGQATCISTIAVDIRTAERTNGKHSKKNMEIALNMLKTKCVLGEMWAELSPAHPNER